MHDEFRVTVEVLPEQAQEVLDALKAVERDDEHGAPSPQHVAVTHQGGHLFLYCDSDDETAQARTTLERILAEKHIPAQASSWRWHPEEDRWEDASLPLPSTPAEHAVEHERLEQLETQESERAGRPEWEVRVTLPTHHDARDFAQRLMAEGYPLRRHWRHLQLGTRDEDEARILAERLQAEAPAGSSVEVEGAAWQAWVTLGGPARPFTIFGGLAY